MCMELAVYELAYSSLKLPVTILVRATTSAQLGGMGPGLPNKGTGVTCLPTISMADWRPGRIRFGAMLTS